MADVFISYSHDPSDRQAAARLAEILQDRGLSVFWDETIATGERWDLALERELGAARAVVVLWSRHSAGREWVREEAMEARRRGILVPAMLDEMTPPLGLRLIQASDLNGWEGEAEHPGLLDLIAAVERIKQTGGTPPGWHLTDLVGSGSRREVATTAFQALAAVALPLGGYGAGLAPLSELSQTWVPGILASLAGLVVVLAGLVTSRWVPARRRFGFWVGTAVVAGVLAIPTIGSYVQRLEDNTIERPVRRGDGFVYERRVKGTQFSESVERYLRRRPELMGNDTVLVLKAGGIEKVWTNASILANWKKLTSGYVATAGAIALVLFALAQALKAPLWRGRYADSGRAAGVQG